MPINFNEPLFFNFEFPVLWRLQVQAQHDCGLFHDRIAPDETELSPPAWIRMITASQRGIQDFLSLAVIDLQSPQHRQFRSRSDVLPRGMYSVLLELAFNGLPHWV